MNVYPNFEMLLGISTLSKSISIIIYLHIRIMKIKFSSYLDSRSWSVVVENGKVEAYSLCGFSLFAEEKLDRTLILDHTYINSTHKGYKIL